jgi:pimeloyl-ACP methyl ester carboxylesterase
MSATQLPVAALDRFLRRVPSPASAISPEFDLARAGGISPEDSVAFYRGRLFVLSDLHGGRMLHEYSAGRLEVQPDAGDWIHSLESNARLTAWNSSPTNENLTATDYDDERWTVDRERAKTFPAVSALHHPNEPLVFQSRRVSPGVSACRVMRDDGTVLARWRCALMGRGVWFDDMLWYTEEVWPAQLLVGRGGADFAVLARHQLPPGILSSLVSDGAVLAGVWTDPGTPASLVTAGSIGELADNVAAFPETPDPRPYRSHCGTIADLSCVVYTPHIPVAGTVLVLHGGPHSLNWPVFSPLISYLCERGWRVVAPNVSSSAMGSRGTEVECEYGVDDAGDVRRLAVAFAADGPVAVVGWSYGAYLAARAVALGMRCSGIGSLGGFFSPEAINEEHPAVGAFLRAYHLPRTDSEDIAHVPVLAVHGRHDTRIKVDVHREYVRRMRSGTFVELPDDGHLIITDAGAAIAYPALTAWLAGLRSTR